MSSNTVICVENLSKSYRLYDSPRQRMVDVLFSNTPKRGKEFVALKPLSFTLEQGETVGIIGSNGSGKSTLLQMIAGTLTPSSGSAKIEGTVAALLELGSGFNPDFTGRENIYLNGAIIGQTRAQMESRLESILAFAEIGEFIDRPLSTYSSGMVVRLAFAVATAIDPQVLIIDEALSVGDEAFQRKCFRRIEQMRENGTSILFVSHSAQAVIHLCNRAIWIERGEMRMDGDPKQVTEAYQKFLHAGATDAVDGNVQEYPPNGGEISHIRLLDEQGETPTALMFGKRYRIGYRLNLTQDVTDIRCGIFIKTRTGVELAGANLNLAEHNQAEAKAGEVLEVEFTFLCSLYPRSYFVNCGVMAVVNGEEQYLHRLIDVLQLPVINPSQRNAHGVAPQGMVDLDFAAKIENQKLNTKINAKKPH